MSRTDLLLFFLLFFCFSYCHQRFFDSPTPASRLDLLNAIVEEGRFVIDSWHENTSDKALFSGHYYSDKAPGTVVVTLPFFALAKRVLRLTELSSDSRAAWLLTSWVACALGIGIPTGLGGVALFCVLVKCVSVRAALITTLAIFLGAAPLPYATLMFSHSLVAGLLAIAIWALLRQRDHDVHESRCGVPGRFSSNRTGDAFPLRTRDRAQFSTRFQAALLANRWNTLTGFTSGLALASEYTSGTVVIGLFVLSVVWVGWRGTFWFVLGAALPVTLVPTYSWLCFGNPFMLPYSHQASFPEMREGLYAIKWPDLPTGLKLLFSPTRGLLFWTPFLAMACLGYRQLFGKSRVLFWLCFLIPILQIVIISGRVWDWQAGFCLGPRFLAPILPLLAAPCAFGLERFPVLGSILAVYSVEITTLATLSDVCPNTSIYNPLTELHLPLLLKGDFSPNLGMTVGMPPYVSIVVFYAILLSGFVWLWRQLAHVEKNEGNAILAQWR